MALITQFLTNIRGFVLTQDGDRLREFLLVEPSAPLHYQKLKTELRNGFRNQGDALESLVENCLPDEDDDSPGRGSPWAGLRSFIKEYLRYWRDVDFDDLPGLHELLSSLLTSCATALSNPSYGTMMLQTSISISESLAKLVMILNKRPDLAVKIRTTAAGDEEKKSIVESTADTIQKIFTSCLMDRSSGRFNRPEGKKVGVYIFANLVLKLLFTCRKSRLASQLFTHLTSNGPSLALYPAAQRVTYLYYLGRFNFDCNHFLRASHCLQEAYSQTPLVCLRHRRLILTYLIPSNMMIGRFPSAELLQRPEAATLGPIFVPLARAVQKGDFVLFQDTIAAHQHWLFSRGLLLSLTYRLRSLVWRSFTRRVFLLTWVPPVDIATSRKAAVLDLNGVMIAAEYVQRRLEGWTPVRIPPGDPMPAARPTPAHVSAIFMKAIVNSTEADTVTWTLIPPPGGSRRLRPSQGLLWGNKAVTLHEIEGVVASLAAEDLMHGFVAHSGPRFAVIGAKQKGSAVLAGWPNVIQTIIDRMREEGDDPDAVPAWVRGE